MAEKELINEETVNQRNLQEEYMNKMDNLEEQQIVDGKIIQVTADTVFIYNFNTQSWREKFHKVKNIYNIQILFELSV